jgi:homoserine dehydrogenase
MLKIAVLGFGTVGSGTVELLDKNREIIKNKTGLDLYVKRILEIKDMSGTPYAARQTDSIEDILNDGEIPVAVEVMGGVTYAYDYVKRCLERGKSVVTSNKELVARKGAELLSLAKANNCRFLFEASTGGAIPILKPLRHDLAANDISGLAGILNGTTNFILTKIIKENMPFSDALELAKSRGYAERDPADDLDGHDACRKICILSSLIYGKSVYPENVYREGITKITAEDAAYAAAWGGAIKLIGSVKRLGEGKILPMVRPAFVAGGSRLSSVDGVFNAIEVYGDAVEKVMFYGRGAGKMPTASAIIADVIEALQFGDPFPTAWEDSPGGAHIADYKDDTLSFYVRAGGVTRERIGELFGDVRFLTRAGAPDGETAFVTAPSTEREFDGKIALIKSSVLGTVRVFEE